MKFLRALKRRCESLFARNSAHNPKARMLHVGGGRVLVDVNGMFPLLVQDTDLMLLPSLFFLGESDLAYFNFLKRYLRDTDTVIDIGANIGYTVLAAGWCLGQSGKVHAFEPSEECRKVLHDNIYMNRMFGLAPQIVVHDCAIGLDVGERVLTYPKVHRGRGSLNRAAVASMGGEGLDLQQVTVTVSRADDVFAQSDQIRLVKVDVEGLEHEVLEVLMPTILDRRIDYLDLELKSDHSGASWARLMELLVGLQSALAPRYYTLAGDGQFVPLTLASIANGASISHCVIDFVDRS